MYDDVHGDVMKRQRNHSWEKESDGVPVAVEAANVTLLMSSVTPGGDVEEPVLLVDVTLAVMPGGNVKGLVSPRFLSFSVKIFNLDNNFDVNHKFEVCTVS